MSFNILVQLTSAGINAGPFDIYAEPSNTLVANNVPRTSLLAPAVYVVTVPDGTTGIVVKSDNVICNNSVNVIVDLPCYCNEINALLGTATIDYVQCDSQDNSVTTFDVANEKAYICAKLGTVQKSNVTGIVDVIPKSKTCSIDDDCFVEPPLCHEIEIIGTSTISWTTAQGTTSTYTYSNVTINVCAIRNSITHTGGTVNITVGTTYCQQESDCWPALNLQATAIDQFIPRYVYIWGAPYDPNQSIIPWMIDFGDGTETYYNGSQVFASGDEHVYTGLFSGTIQIKAPSLELIKALYSNISGMSFTTGSVALIGSEISKLVNLESITNLNWELIANATDLPNSLKILYSLRGEISGSVSNLPSTLTQITLIGDFENNTLDGLTSDFPTGLTILRIDGSNTIHGDIANFPAAFDTQLVTLLIEGDNYVSGNINQFSTYTVMTDCTIRGYNTLTGTICSFSSIMKTIVLTGYSEPSGNLSCLIPMTGLRTIELQNDEDDPVVIAGNIGNTIVGNITDVPETVSTCIIRGNNTINGTIANMPAGTGSTETYFNIGGDNTLTGNISTIKTNCKYFVVEGQNTLSGNLSSIPTGTIVRFIVIVDAPAVSGITGNIAQIPPTIIQFGLQGNISVNTYIPSPGPGRTWAANMNYFVHEPNDRTTYKIPTTQLDRLIQDLAATNWTTTFSFPTNEFTAVGARSIPGTNGYITTLQNPPNNVVIDVSL